MRTRVLAWVALLGAGLLLSQAPAMGADKDQNKSKVNESHKKLDDQTFLQKATRDNLDEINLGRLAAERGGTQAVRDFGNLLVRNHSTANENLLRIVNKDHFKVPATMDAKHKELMKKLSGLRGAEFDHVFVEHMVKDHQKAVAMFKDEAKNGQNPDLKNYAQTTLPVLQKHLSIAERLEKTFKTSTGTGHNKKER